MKRSPPSRTNTRKPKPFSASPATRTARSAAKAKVEHDAGAFASKKTVMFLGAGASCAEGAPLQAKLFAEYFKYLKTHPRTFGDWGDREVATFFEDFFGIDVDHDNLDSVRFPTFEEVLGILEMAKVQSESFLGWGNSNLISGSQRIQPLQELLVLLIADVLDKTLGDDPAKHHKLLLKSLGDALPNVVFISFNYDILMDNALVDLHDVWDLDYGLEFANYERQGGWHRPRAGRGLKLYKLHGSLNWLYCPTCRLLELTPKEKGVCRLKTDPGACLCETCETVTVPIVIPPTYFKSLSNYYLSQIWNAAESALMDCDRIVFCGYSFPDADVHVRYLLKRVELQRVSKPIEIYVVNHHRNKSDAVRDEERARYTRFLRARDRVHWTNLSFEEFAADPSLIEDQSRWVANA